jgi:hypothetical protein
VPFSITAPETGAMRAFLIAKYRGSPPAPRAAHAQPTSPAQQTTIAASEILRRFKRSLILHLTIHFQQHALDAGTNATLTISESERCYRQVPMKASHLRPEEVTPGRTRPRQSLRVQTHDKRLRFREFRG